MNAAVPKWKHFIRAYGLEDDDKDERDWQTDRVRLVSLRVVGNPVLEPDDGKPSSPVLRGLGASNGAWPLNTYGQDPGKRKPDKWPHCPVSSARQVTRTRTEHNTFFIDPMTLDNTLLTLVRIANTRLGLSFHPTICPRES
jgi:hypothetical protein